MRLTELSRGMLPLVVALCIVFGVGQALFADSPLRSQRTSSMDFDLALLSSSIAQNFQSASAFGIVFEYSHQINDSSSLTLGDLTSYMSTLSGSGISQFLETAYVSWDWHPFQGWVNGFFIGATSGLAINYTWYDNPTLGVTPNLTVGIEIGPDIGFEYAFDFGLHLTAAIGYGVVPLLQFAGTTSSFGLGLQFVRGIVGIGFSHNEVTAPIVEP